MCCVCAYVLLCCCSFVWCVVECRANVRSACANAARAGAAHERFDAGLGMPVGGYQYQNKEGKATCEICGKGYQHQQQHNRSNRSNKAARSTPHTNRTTKQRRRTAQNISSSRVTLCQAGCAHVSLYPACPCPCLPVCVAVASTWTTPTSSVSRAQKVCTAQTQAQTTQANHTTNTTQSRAQTTIKQHGAQIRSACWTDQPWPSAAWCCVCCVDGCCVRCALCVVAYCGTLCVVLCCVVGWHCPNGFSKRLWKDRHVCKDGDEYTCKAGEVRTHKATTHKHT